MKLPSDNPNDGEQPPSSSGDNPGGAEGGSGSNSEGPSASSSGTGEEGGGRRSAQASSTSSGQGGTEAVDFSEYLWMENEEEFDTQVLQELEDEEMINYYYELYEASLNENGTWGPNTANLRVTGPPPPFNPDAARAPQGQGDDPVDSLTQGISNRLNLGSRLNPEAAEFVPRTTNMTSPN